MRRLIPFKSLFYASAIAFTLTLSPTFAAKAGIVRKISASQLLGTVENSPLQTVEVWNGHGVSISFYQTGDIVKKIFYDDSSNVSLDVDGCLEGLSKCPGDSQGGAGLIYLRRTNKILIPGLPQAEYGAHLTVITESKNNPDAKKIYHFAVLPGSGKPKYSEVEVVDDTVKNNDSQTPLRANYKALTDAKNITKGMKIALEKKWIETNGDLWQRLMQVVKLRVQGEELNSAANLSGVSEELINKLISLGRSN